MRQISAADVSPQWPILEPLEGCRERPVALSKPVCVAGDRVRVNLTLRAETVSRAHVIFVSDDRGAYLRDLASLNHVFVNEEPVREAALAAGDVIKIGPFAFRCNGGISEASEPAQFSSTAPAAELRTPDDSIHVPLNTRRTTVLGSRDDCDVKMAGEKVSPAHAVIFEMRGGRYIRDLRSMSGTFINGRKVGQAELHPDDEIQIGESKLIYSSAPAHDPDGTLTGVLAEGEAPATAEAEPAVSDAVAPQVAAADAAAPSDDLETIPLLEEPELQSLAQEFAEEKQSKEPSQASESAPAKSDSAIIPLLDDSEFAPGLAPESAIDPTIPETDSVIPLAAEDSAAPIKPEATPAPAKAPRGRKRDASELRGSTRKRKLRSPSDSRTPGMEASKA
jgi:pSer/pThr/pTyr-binding forkhead associated (FHA) protein